ncbi:O-succinylhomoserine sulfhydrylase [Sinimarinibacterium sp. NLF-5-8]|uniref:O-succinylhomoserine sulfhydrylase n=1 Tax=Sinimarinibacterium sp. NLF-5-8 TaxID=2698684 RepID=UPI00137BBBC2|nr:O-succinylhomoserine sulfhydrylase [Sinimarinibacterium sp. NLF-5-8]QHS09722.1 O-succinylhomoserine sulfhydrylase [Sinimarinibacterium sp. NLF-5-8]
MNEPESEWGMATLGIRAAQMHTDQREHSPTLSLSSSYTYRSAEEAAAVFHGDQPGYIYSRFANPTVQAFERRLAALEGGHSCVATASGMAAVLSLCLTHLKAGDHIVASHSLFGSTISLFNNILSRFGLQTHYVDATDLAAIDAAMTAHTKLLFVETPSNPLTELIDIGAVAEIAHRHGALLCVDNCFLTPVLQQPLKLGADFVIHSATKYLDGQGRCVGGAIVGDAERVGRDVFGFLRTAGTCMSPFNAWVFLKGMETLELRMRAHCANSLALAQWLEAQPQVTRVFYPGLPSHPQHALAQRQQSGFGGIVSFEVAGARAGAWGVINATQMISITANLGDTRTTITHPASTTHGRISEQARAEAGISEGLLRLSVGLENIEDLKRDLARGLRSP